MKSAPPKPPDSRQAPPLASAEASEVLEAQRRARRLGWMGILMVVWAVGGMLALLFGTKEPPTEASLVQALRQLPRWRGLQSDSTGWTLLSASDGYRYVIEQPSVAPGRLPLLWEGTIRVVAQSRRQDSDARESSRMYRYTFGVSSGGQQSQPGVGGGPGGGWVMLKEETE